MGFGSDYWAPQAGPNAFAPDLPGYGDVTGPFTARTAIDALASAAREAGGGSPLDVVGVSLGARLAIHLAEQHPELVRSLSISGLGPDSSGLTAWLQVILMQLMPAGPLTRQSTRATKRAAVETAKALPALGVRGMLSRVTAPTIVWWGDQDHASEKASRMAAECIHGAQFEAIPGGRHLWTHDMPDEFERRFTNWIDNLS